MNPIMIRFWEFSASFSNIILLLECISFPPLRPDLKTIELHSRNTLFWRHQDGKPDTYLSTIEAIYYLMRDFHDIFMSSDYNNEYDNLLFFFCHLYSKITASKKARDYQNKPKQNKKTKKSKLEKTDINL